MTSEYIIEGATPEQNKLLEDIAFRFDVKEDHLFEIADDVYKSLADGLRSEKDAKGVPCLVSYIKSEITQDIREAEKSEMVVLGMTINTTASRIKIASVQFVQGAPDAINKQIFYLPDEESITPTKLLEDASTHVAQFINTHNLVPEPGQPPLSMGVTIDLPLEETSKSGGHVISNSLACHKVLSNLDLAHALNSVMLKRHLPVKVTSATNCVISTMVAAQHHFHSTCIALILNHGINASYYEKAAKIPKISGSELGNSDARVAINTELARFGEHSSVLNPTMWDHRIDRESPNTGYYTFEKLVADKYLGEIVRNLITDFMDSRLIFSNHADVSMFSTPYSFFTSYMTIMEDSSDDLSEVGDLLRAGFNIDASLVDRKIVSSLCKIVAMRAAKLVGGAAVGLAKKATEAMDTPEPTVISISGKLTEMNQPYLECTMKTARKLASKTGLEEPIFNILGEDGYTVGAALSSLSK
ncbi:hypothetical protein IW140_001871 [Coemansia sp. RSA 1813]|nr:hypothetical protein EV178_005043 [Coemansia sp. RSA 1646]KAJ1772387.1 hypothetical protein LPJ74_001477 [Coemansia sp. RSA 1843]KAJ2091110.1 hypothetical protein IW138_002072 [Coemansia sp. RSA 986]KAJ2212120.1 hypothetical protein EV179_004917 [Coemansia sp. RSA 487]KAJ2571168.1 hypothetical protein IW140_001871 [Coemansia sp. RSA 1813]